MTTRIIPFAALESLRLSCRQCGFAAVLPLAVRNAPQQCPNCAHPLPGADFVALAKQLHWAKTAAADVAFGFDAALEAREERG